LEESPKPVYAKELLAVVAMPMGVFVNHAKRDRWLADHGITSLISDATGDLIFDLLTNLPAPPAAKGDEPTSWTAVAADVVLSGTTHMLSAMLRKGLVDAKVPADEGWCEGRGGLSFAAAFAGRPDMLDVLYHHGLRFPTDRVAMSPDTAAEDASASSPVCTTTQLFTSVGHSPNQSVALNLVRRGVDAFRPNARGESAFANLVEHMPEAALAALRTKAARDLTGASQSYLPPAGGELWRYSFRGVALDGAGKLAHRGSNGRGGPARLGLFGLLPHSLFSAALSPGAPAAPPHQDQAKWWAGAVTTCCTCACATAARSCSRPPWCRSSARRCGRRSAGAATAWRWAGTCPCSASSWPPRSPGPPTTTTAAPRPPPPRCTRSS
jgi:hypothetical protein